MKKFSFIRTLAPHVLEQGRKKIKSILKTKISMNFKVWVPSYPPLADNVLYVAGSRLILYSIFWQIDDDNMIQFLFISSQLSSHICPRLAYQTFGPYRIYREPNVSQTFGALYKQQIRTFELLVGVGLICQTIVLNV